MACPSISIIVTSKSEEVYSHPIGMAVQVINNVVRGSCEEQNFCNQLRQQLALSTVYEHNN